MSLQPAPAPGRHSYNAAVCEENHFLGAWRRCAKLGSPLHGPRKRGLPAMDELCKLQRQHRGLIDVAAPHLVTLWKVLRAEPSHVVLLLNREGRILDMRADQWTRSRGARVNLFPGASVAEADIGNNGPGTALATGRTISFAGFEHYNQSLLGWQTMGVPILTPNGRHLGALGIFLSRYSRVCHKALTQLMLQARMLGHAACTAESGTDTASPGHAPTDDALYSDQLQMAMRIMGGFAHEVRNPLAVIRGFAQLLLEDKAPDRVDRYLPLIIDEVDRMNERVRGFISLPADDKAHRRNVDVYTLLHDAKFLLQGCFHQNGIQLRVEVAPDTGTVWGNAEQLRQAILNLAYNARESVPADGKVLLSAARAGDLVRITVTDSGVGITSEVMPRVFEPFFSTADGVGLGLPISKDIVDRHGGTLDLQSTPDQGTTVTITLPAADSSGDGP